mgnify:CR=1 FL=1|jgi:HD-GYP domain-containing protein (c-di-GMP phosphodiesterase class II)
MRKLRISFLKPGMTLAKPVYGPDGQLWLNAGIKLQARYIRSLEKAGIKHVYIEDPLLHDVPLDEVVSQKTRIIAIKAVKETIDSMQRGILRNGGALNNRFIFAVERLIREVLENQDVIYNMVDIRYTDNYTFNHSINVCILSLLIGCGLSKKRTFLEDLAVGSLLHDVGKIWINESILKKKGSLTPEEIAEIKKHPEYGQEILSRYNCIPAASIGVAVQHHERYDGSGYPCRLSGDDIGLLSRLVMVVDVFDALTADRPYRKALLPHEAVEIITSSTKLYDAEMIRCFLNHVAAFPIGTCLRLSSGELGLVVKCNRGFPLRPVVRVCKNSNGAFYKEPYDLDLTEKLDIVITEVLSDEEREKELPLKS